MYLVSNIYNCSIENIYGCLENILLATFAIILLIFCLQSNLKIFKDKNQILDKIDILMLFFSFIQILLLVLYFSFLSTHLILFTIRSFSFANCLISCYIIFCFFDGDESRISKYYKITKLSFLYLIFLWLFCAFFKSKTIEAPYNCKRLDWILISGSMLVCSCIVVYVGLSIISIIQNCSD